MQLAAHLPDHPCAHTRAVGDTYNKQHGAADVDRSVAPF